MPFVRVEVFDATSAATRAVIADAVYEAMRETIGIPEGDRFIVVSARGKDELFVDRAFQGMQRTDRFVLVQIVLSHGRSQEKKQALYRRVAERLHQSAGVPADDVMVVLTENNATDWSFGKGVAQFILNPPAWVQPAGEMK